jgi:dipeptidase E
VLDVVEESLIGTKAAYFAPYAVADYDGSTQRVRDALSQFGVEVIGLHTTSSARAAVEGAEVLFVGGGNSFRLVRALQEHGLLELVRRRVKAGELRYIGSSAGTNMACPTMRTTNDMPIVQPSSFEAFGLIPFQINPHYQDPDPNSTHMGETREQRIVQFLEENDVAVLGMREGSWLHRRGDDLILGGTTGARLFMRGQEPRELTENDDLSFLLTLTPCFDQRI